ncbi:pilus assembly protein PilM [Bremerella cremea]|uniref:pilus assembly protein PilM n=1 Tax=Bremerella cremea TaxID=1031537 RepID=UPI0031E96D82
MIHKYTGAMPTTDSTIDPYDRLLRVKTEGKTPDFYTLLRLDLFEDDINFIRSHGEKARKQLHAKFGEIDPAQWRDVFNHVEDAIATLSDPDKKNEYDKTLKHEQNGATLKTANSNGGGSNGHGAAHAGDRIDCRKCSTPNPPSRRFCSACGDALYVACPQCGGMNTVHERFCGECGVNLQASANAQREALESKFDEAETLLKDGRHDRACETLRQLTKAQHEGEMEFAKRAAKLITQITLEKEQLLAKAPEVEAEARQLRDGKHAEKAVSVIREIPKALWHESLRELYDEVSEIKKQIKRLAQEIKLAIQERRTSRLLPKVEKLLELKPHDISAQRLAEKLRKSQDQADRLKREKLVEKAKEYIKQFRYERAYQVLTEVPESVRTENFTKFFDQVSELAFLSADLRRSRYADPTLVGMASRLVKLMPKDKHAIDRLHKITQKWEQSKKNPATADRTWNEMPKKTPLGVPVDLYPRFRKFNATAVADNEHFENFSSGFIVATGLALQGLGLSRVETNLIPNTSGGVFGLLGGGKKAAASDLAWGLDLSNSGLKAILLRKEVKGDKTNQTTVVHIEQMVKVDYKRPLSRADDADRRGLIQDVVDQFFSIVGKDALQDKRGKTSVCLSLPATEVLGRFLTLPPVEDKKIPKTVQYEVRHQIPFPIEELSWDYHVWDDKLTSEELNLESEAKRHCVVVATRLSKLQERLAFLRGLGITPHLVQTDQLAIYNFFDFDLFSDPSYREQMEETEQALGILDVGSDASHLVICGANSIWFRSLEVGGENFTRILVRQMSLTFSKAEELKKKPDTADEIFKLYDVLDPVLKNISKESSYSVNTYSGLDRERLAEVKLIGGGSYMHGLLTFLQHGKFLDV